VEAVINSYVRKFLFPMLGYWVIRGCDKKGIAPAAVELGKEALPASSR
jgi:hypothetical protein